MQGTWNLVNSFSVPQHTWLRRLFLTHTQQCPFLVLLEHSELTLSKYTNGCTTLDGWLASITDILPVWGKGRVCPVPFSDSFKTLLSAWHISEAQRADTNKQATHPAGCFERPGDGRSHTALHHSCFIAAQSCRHFSYAVHRGCTGLMFAAWNSQMKRRSRCLGAWRVQGALLRITSQVPVAKLVWFS